jgi:hypothetical protein
MATALAGGPLFLPLFPCGLDQRQLAGRQPGMVILRLDVHYMVPMVGSKLPRFWKGRHSIGEESMYELKPGDVFVVKLPPSTSEFADWTLAYVEEVDETGTVTEIRLGGSWQRVIPGGWPWEFKIQVARIPQYQERARSLIVKFPSEGRTWDSPHTLLTDLDLG